MRKIESLSDHEHLLLRPNAYVGSTESMEDKIIIYDIDAKYFVSKNKVFSEGFYRIFDEVLDNAFDEAKRCFSEGFRFEKIKVKVDSKTNEVIITDSGRGFIDGEMVNEKTGLTNIETALTKLRAGSNFRNTDYKVSIIGMNGIGVSATNILSDVFEVETHNSKITYKQRWEKFSSVEKIVEDNNNPENTFTSIKFIPRKEIFKDAKYDFEILFSKLLFRKFQIDNDDELNGIDIEFIFDDVAVDLAVQLFPENHISINVNKNLTLVMWEVSDANMCNISFVNSSQCSGFHQKYIEEYINEKLFDNDTANQFYRTLVMMNLKPKYVQFQEQNKNRFVTTRAIMEKILPLKLSKIEMDRVKNSDTFIKIKDSILESENKKHVKKIKKNRNNAFKFSDKFLNSTKKENIFLTEGNSASSACAQKRNANTDSIYTLRGKIKNTRNLADLTESPIIVEMINILGLSIEDGGESCSYKKIIIASDKDFDGNSIAGLIINFFYKWFPKVITNNKLYLLNSPLITYESNKEVKYLYSLNDYDSIPSNAKNIRYLKGLGSLSKEDWAEVFKKLPLISLRGDIKTSENLELAFGEDIKRRKKWLMMS